MRCASVSKWLRPSSQAIRIRCWSGLRGRYPQNCKVGSFVQSGSLRNIFTQVPVSAFEMQQAGEMARKPPAEIASADVQAALQLFVNMPGLTLPPEQVSALAQQLFRVLLSYQHWYLPRVMREDMPGNLPALWSVGVPSPDAAPGGGQLLPLASDEAAFQSLTGGGVRDGAAATIVKTAISGVDAIFEHLHGQGRWEGLVLNPGSKSEVMIGKDKLALMHMWEATLRCEALMNKELVESTGPTFVQPPASDQLAGLLAGQVKLCFVQMGQDLARDTSGQNIVTLTSNDAAALCATAYGREMVRPVTPEELLEMAENSGGAFSGYALTAGADIAPYANADEKHIPVWHTCVVPAEWMAAALRQGLSKSL